MKTASLGPLITDVVHTWKCKECGNEWWTGGMTKWHHPVIAERDCFFCGFSNRKAKAVIASCPRGCVGFDVDLLPRRSLLTYLRDCYHHRDSRLIGRAKC